MLTLLAGIDTESDNQWDAAARANPTFENLYALPRLHDVFSRYAVRPTYFITYPVARNARAATVLRALLTRSDCEIGAHHHAWETPPYSPDAAARHPYASALPVEQFEQQLKALTDAITEAIGAAPVSYRSGRFGFSPQHVAGLEHAGYRVESSVTPLFYEAHKAGPDFVRAPLQPYFLSYDDATTPGTSSLLEIPVSAALNRRLPRVLQHAYARAPRPYMTKRILRALRLVKMVWLRPSYSSLADMCALASRLERDRVPVLNLLFHSSEAIPAGSPYNRTQDDLDRFLDRLDRFLRFATANLGARPATFAEFRAAYAGER